MASLLEVGCLSPGCLSRSAFEGRQKFALEDEMVFIPRVRLRLAGLDWRRSFEIKLRSDIQQNNTCMQFMSNHVFHGSQV